MSSNKLQKILAQAGLGSRRSMEKKILKGTIKINEKIANLGDRVSPKDKIVVDGKPLIYYSSIILRKPRIIIYYKPAGQICTKKDPENRQSVFDALPNLNKKTRWVMVGRLDINTLGLLIFTTDSELANRLMHPAYEVKREYIVRVFGKLSPEQIKLLINGIVLKDGLAQFQSIYRLGGQGRNTWYRVTLSEGKNREIHRIFEVLNLQVSRLIRVSYGNIQLPRYLSSGEWEELPLDFVNIVRKSVKMKSFKKY